MMTDAKPFRIVMDVPISPVTMKEAVARCMDMVREEKAHLIATANAEMIMNAQEDARLMHILKEADLVVPDGAGVLWAGDVLHTPFPERVAGIDLMTRLLEEAAQRKWPVYFLGGAPGVAGEAAERFRRSHEGLTMAGIHDGYFDAAEEERILKEIRDKGTKLLFVGMGVPKQEKWLHHHKEELGPVLAMGVGGAFDVLAGRLKRAPLWMQKHRLEWAYRLYLQPERIGRMMALPRFMMAVKHWKKENAK